MNPKTLDETATPARQMRELVRLYLIKQRRFAHDQGLSSHGRLLILIQKHGPLTQGEFGRIAGMEKSWVSRIVDRFVADGLIERRPLESDRRCLEQMCIRARLEAASRDILGRAQEIDSLSSSLGKTMHESLTSAGQLSTSTEEILASGARFKLGMGKFEAALGLSLIHI